MKKIMALLLFLSLSIPTFAQSTDKEETIELSGNNVVLLNTEIKDDTMDTFAAAVVGKRIMLGPDKPLYILIVSGGGLYGTSLRMKRLFEVIPDIQVICKYCASAAGMLFVTHKGPRLVTNKSVLLMHEMYIEHATAKIVTNLFQVRMLIKNSDDFNKMHYDLIGISKEEYEKKIVGKEWTVEGKDIIKLHLADKFVHIHCNDYLKSMAPDTCTEKPLKPD